MSTSFTLNRLASHLKTETASQHEYMHQLMEKAQVFKDVANYAKFTLSQYYFQKMSNIYF